MPKFSYVVDVSKSCNDTYSSFKDVVGLGKCMNFVDEVSILEQKDNIVVSKWKVSYDGVCIEWTEEMKYNDADKTIQFKSLTGDYSRFGLWKIYNNKNNNKTSISLDITYDWNAPNFEHFFGDVYKEKAEIATRGMVYALKKRLSK